MRAQRARGPVPGPRLPRDRRAGRREPRASNAGAARELHLAGCRTLRKYPDGRSGPRPADRRRGGRGLGPGDRGGHRRPRRLATEWPFSAETGWCPLCIVKVVPRTADGCYKHPAARSPQVAPGGPAVPAGSPRPTGSTAGARWRPPTSRRDAGADGRPIVSPQGFSHVRLTVTDIHRSKAFYSRLFGMPPGATSATRSTTRRSGPTRGARTGAARSRSTGRPSGCVRSRAAGDVFDPDRVGLDHLSLRVGSVAELHAAAERLTEAGIEHGAVTDLPPFGLVVLSLQDPDGINLELAAPRPAEP